MHQSIDRKKRILVYIVFLLILSTFSFKISNQPKKYLLKINKIIVAGLSNSKNLEIQNDLSTTLYQNIFTLKKEKVNKIINKYNIIEEYEIKKTYPSTLNIVIKPTKFLARITDNTQLLVGSNGKLIYNEKSDIILPYIFGKFNSKKFLEFKKNIELSKFNFAEFKTIYFFPSNRWDILTNDNTLIKLPQGNVSKSLNLAYKIISNTQFKDKDIIDLRVKNNLIVK